MRLGTCIALELAALAGALGGMGLAVSRGSGLVGEYLDSRAAAAATLVRDAPAVPLVRLERANLAIAPPVIGNVFGASDADLLAPLAASPVTRVKLNHGGTSLSLRLDFASGTRAAFKPLQSHQQSDPRREIAAYRIDRLLGIGRVPPAKSAAFALDALLDAIDPSSRTFAESRILDEAIVRHGKLIGEVSWWIPEIKLVRMGGHPIDEAEGQALWSGQLQVGATIPDDHRPMLVQIATAILFDVLIDNSDRWSGNNTQGSPDHRDLYLMDNTLSFSQLKLGHASNLSKLYKIQVFPRGLVQKLRALTEDSIRAALGQDDELLGPLLTRGEIRAIIARRDHLLEYVDGLIDEHGEDAVLAFP